MTHDPLCYVNIPNDVFAGPCTCAYVARVREDERATTLRDARKAVLGVDYGDWLIRRTAVVEAIWALVDTQSPPKPMTHTCPDNNCCMGDLE